MSSSYIVRRHLNTLIVKHEIPVNTTEKILIDLHNWFSLDQYSVNVWWHSDILSKSLVVFYFLILDLNFVLILINWNIYIFLYFLTLTD